MYNIYIYIWHAGTTAYFFRVDMITVYPPPPGWWDFENVD